MSILFLLPLPMDCRSFLIHLQTLHEAFIESNRVWSIPFAKIYALLVFYFYLMSKLISIA